MAVVAVDLQSQCDALRTKLKEWERRHFAKTGCKASRKDIAANSDIAIKYKEYEKLRSTLSGKTQKSRLSTKANDADRKRKPIEELSQDTPRKRPALAVATPNAQRQTNADVPAAEEETPQSVVKQLIFGPTPQKDGIPLGIFAHLPTNLLQATPSASRTLQNDANALNVAITPSKIVPATPSFEGSKFSRTPMSDGRRFMLNMIVTPRHEKDQDQHGRTPTTSDRLFQTPAFLRRHNTAPLPTMDEETSPHVKVAGQWKRSSFGRSLSSMIQDLRKQEDDRLDREMDIMRELEAENDANVATIHPRVTVDFKDITPAKNQSHMELDEDGFIPSDVEAQLKEIDEAEAATAAKAGRPLKIYKKKGLKRQTRRVNMRPVRNRTKTKQQQDAQEQEADSGDSGEDATANMVPETQYDVADEHVSEFEEEVDVPETTESASDAAKLDAPTKASNNSGSAKAAKKKKVPDRNNYCKLKIKNKNSKANGRGRFGRRR